MIKKGFKAAKEKIDNIMENGSFSSDEVLPHTVDSKLGEIVKSINGYANEYPEKLSRYFNIESKNPTVIMKHVTKKVDLLYKKDSELQAFINRFNNFVETIEIEEIKRV